MPQFWGNRSLDFLESSLSPPPGPPSYGTRNRKRPFPHKGLSVLFSENGQQLCVCLLSRSSPGQIITERMPKGPALALCATPGHNLPAIFLTCQSNSLPEEGKEKQIITPRLYLILLVLIHPLFYSVTIYLMPLLWSRHFSRDLGYSREQNKQKIPSLQSLHSIV